MKEYMRSQFEFLGIPTPERTEWTRAFFKEQGYPEISELEYVVTSLWNLPEREYHYVALGILDKSVKKMSQESIQLFEHLIMTKSWWDTVDHIAANLVGTHFTRYPQLIPSYVDKWLSSDDLWLQRTALLFQLKWKQQTDEQLLFKTVEHLMHSEEFFIRKAIGWALREYSKTSPERVVEFVRTRPLSSLSTREALKVVHKAATT